MHDPMIVFLVFFGVCLMAALSWNCWALYCNGRTYRERTAILRAISGPGRDKFWSLHQEYDAVSYEQHISALKRLRDARKLYGPLIRTLMGWGDA